MLLIQSSLDCSSSPNALAKPWRMGTKLYQLNVWPFIFCLGYVRTTSYVGIIYVAQGAE